MITRAYQSAMLGSLYESRDEYDGFCSLSIAPYLLMIWPDSFCVVQATIVFAGAAHASQALNGRTNDEFGLSELFALNSAHSNISTAMTTPHMNCMVPMGIPVSPSFPEGTWWNLRVKSALHICLNHVVTHVLLTQENGWHLLSEHAHILSGSKHAHYLSRSTRYLACWHT